MFILQGRRTHGIRTESPVAWPCCRYSPLAGDLLAGNPILSGPAAAAGAAASAAAGNGTASGAAAAASAINGSGWCIFVYNLAPETEENILWQLFGPFGAVQVSAMIFGERLLFAIMKPRYVAWRAGHRK